MTGRDVLLAPRSTVALKSSIGESSTRASTSPASCELTMKLVTMAATHAEADQSDVVGPLFDREVDCPFDVTPLGLAVAVHAFGGRAAYRRHCGS